MTAATTPEWAAGFGLALGLWGTGSCLYFLLVDLDYEAMTRDAALTAVAFLLILTPNPVESR